MLRLSSLASFVVLIACSALALGGCSRSEPATSAAQPVALHYTVEKMHCDGCVWAISNKVTAIPGVTSCKVELEAKTADIEVTDAALASKVEDAIKRLGYEVARKP